MTTTKIHRIEIHGTTDELGRCSHTIFWMADYHPGDPRGENRVAERAQCRFGVPPTKTPRGYEFART